MTAQGGVPGAETDGRASLGGPARRLADAGFRVDRRVAVGHPGRRIVEAATADRYHLVVLGAGNHRWLGRLLLGSTSTHVLQHSPTSLLIVHDPPRQSVPLRVLMATDGSPEADEAALMLRRFADPVRCRVTVFSVARMPLLSTVPPSLLAGVPRHAEFVESLVDDAERAAETTAGVLRREGFRADTAVTDGAAHRLVLGECQDGGYDLVVVGSRGLGRVAGAILGSVSQAVARHAPAALIGRTL